MPIGTIRQDGAIVRIVKSDGEITSVIVDVSTPDRIAELKMILQRALQTLEPEKTPQWASDLLDVLNGVK